MFEGEIFTIIPNTFSKNKKDIKIPHMILYSFKVLLDLTGDIVYTVLSLPKM